MLQINSLEGTSDREALGIQAIGLVILKNGTLDAYGFGGLQNCLKDMALHLKLLGLSTGGDMANSKHFIDCTPCQDECQAVFVSFFLKQLVLYKLEKRGKNLFTFLSKCS